MCCDEDVVNIADIYFGFSYYVGHVEFRNGRTKGVTPQFVYIYIYIYIYVAGEIIEWSFYGSGKEEIMMKLTNLNKL